MERNIPKQSATNTRAVSILESNGCANALFDYCLRDGGVSLESPFVLDEFFLDPRLIRVNHHDEQYIIHLIKTPCHSDFIGEAVAALRITDGAIVVVDCEVGVTQHTISLLQRAREEHVRLVLLLDKVDSVLRHVSPQEASAVMDLLLWKLNTRVPLIHNEFSFVNDNILLGSLQNDWVVTADQLSRGLNDALALNETEKIISALYELRERTGSTRGGGEDVEAELFHVTMRNLCGSGALYELIVKRVPSPVEAQKYRAVQWYVQAHQTDEVLDAMKQCDPNGPTVLFISKFVWGRLRRPSEEIPLAIGRVICGSIQPGQPLYYVRSDQTEAPSVVKLEELYMLSSTVEKLDICQSGAIVLIRGVAERINKEATLASLPTTSALTTVQFNPTLLLEDVVTTNDDHMKNVLKLLSKCDSASVYYSNDFDGDVLCAFGTKHAEVLLERYQTISKASFHYFGPHYRYRESIIAPSPGCLAKSASKTNRVWTRVRPMDSTLKMILSSQNRPFTDLKRNVRLLNSEYLFVAEELVILNDLVEPNVVVIDKSLTKQSQLLKQWIDMLRHVSSFRCLDARCMGHNYHPNRCSLKPFFRWRSAYPQQ